MQEFQCADLVVSLVVVAAGAMNLYEVGDTIMQEAAWDLDALLNQSGSLD